MSFTFEDERQMYMAEERRLAAKEELAERRATVATKVVYDAPSIDIDMMRDGDVFEVEVPFGSPQSTYLLGCSVRCEDAVVVAGGRAIRGANVEALPTIQSKFGLRSAFRMVWSRPARHEIVTIGD